MLVELEIDQASRAHEKKYRPCREMLERGSGSLGFASWAHNLSDRMEPFEGQRGCPNQTNLLIGHKAIYPDCTMVLSWASIVRSEARPISFQTCESHTCKGMAQDG